MELIFTAQLSHFPIYNLDDSTKTSLTIAIDYLTADDRYS